MHAEHVFFVTTCDTNNRRERFKRWHKLTIWFKLCCDICACCTGAFPPPTLLLATPPPVTPFTMAVVTGVARVPFVPVLVLLFGTGLGAPWPDILVVYRIDRNVNLMMWLHGMKDVGHI